MTYELKNPENWPQIVVILYGKDYFGRSVARGYGNIHMPSAEGRQTRKIRIF
jgi:B9 domain-containing protein 1